MLAKSVYQISPCYVLHTLSHAMHAVMLPLLGEGLTCSCMRPVPLGRDMHAARPFGEGHACGPSLWGGTCMRPVPLGRDMHAARPFGEGHACGPSLWGGTCMRPVPLGRDMHAARTFGERLCSIDSNSVKSH